MLLKTQKYKLPDQGKLKDWHNTYTLFTYVDPETKSSFCIAYTEETCIEKCVATFSWAWVLNTEDPSKNDRLRVAHIQIYDSDRCIEAYDYYVNNLRDTLIFYYMEPGCTYTQPDYMRSERYGPLQRIEKCCFIFDLDGTLVDTQKPFHAAAESYVLKKFCNIDINPDEISHKFAGMPTKTVFSSLAPSAYTNILVQEKWKYMHQLTGNKEIKIFPWMEQLLRVLGAQNVPLALASASPVAWIKTCLEIKNFFDKRPLKKEIGDRYISAEECGNPKPDPEVFVRAREKMFARYPDYDPKCFVTYVVGDGEADVKAGLVMGAKVLFISSDCEIFDAHPSVTRFKNHEDLYHHIMKYCI